MEKLKTSSFYFAKHFIFLFFAVVFFTNGFFISNCLASETIITGDIVVDTHWGIEGSPYIVDVAILIDRDVTLTIDAGVIVKFNPNNNAYLYVLGKIIANGVIDNPIYFTSKFDDSVGGSTDEDDLYCYFDNYDEEGNGVGEEICDMVDYYEPSADDWGGIYFSSSSGSNLKNINFKYADSAISFESSSGGLENLNIDNSNSGVFIYKNSNVNISNINLDNIDKDAFLILQNSKLVLNDGSISNTRDGVTLYDNSYISANNLNIECVNDGIVAYIDSSLDISKGNISCGHDGILLFNEVKANIGGVNIKNAQDAGILVYNNTNNEIKFTKNEVANNNYGFVVFNSPIFVNQNSIHNNITNGALTFGVSPLSLDFKSNYWGDKTGPTHSSNVSGLGDFVSDHILFFPFLENDPLINVRNPVIIIPGITASYLNRDYGDKSEIWPDIMKLMLSLDLSDSFLNDLVLNEDGSENIEYPIKVGDIIRGVPWAGVHVFDNLIEAFIKDGYKEDTDLFVFPYDWRKSSTFNSDLLKDKIDSVIAKTGISSVDIIAHSMGGIIAKKYISDNGSNNIDQLVFLGTPQLGSPKSFKALMFGDNMGYGIYLKIKKLIFLILKNLKKFPKICHQYMSFYQVKSI